MTGIQNLSDDVYQQLLDERNELRSDMRFVKENLTRLIKIIGIVDEDGNTQDAKHIVKSLTALVPMLISGKIKKEFEFVTEFMPLIKKYKDL